MDPRRFDTIARAFADRRSRRSLLRGSAGLGLAAVAAVPMLAAAQDATPDATPVAAAPRAETDPSFLFVQSFGSGTMVPGDDPSSYRLTLTEGLGQTVAFSDRPDRIVAATPTADWLSAFPFPDSNPPNAALVAQSGSSGAETDVVVMELRNPQYDADSRTATYDATLLEDYARTGITFQQEPSSGADLPASFGAASLFIDDCADATDCMRREGARGFREVIGAYPGGSVAMCWSWGDVACEPCHDPAAVYGACNGAYSDCDDDCYVA